jgi:hypothetical protein
VPRERHPESRDGLPKVLWYNVHRAAPGPALVAEALGVNRAAMGERDAALAAADAVEAPMPR